MRVVLANPEHNGPRLLRVPAAGSSHQGCILNQLRRPRERVAGVHGSQLELDFEVVDLRSPIAQRALQPVDRSLVGAQSRRIVRGRAGHLSTLSKEPAIAVLRCPIKVFVPGRVWGLHRWSDKSRTSQLGKRLATNSGSELVLRPFDRSRRVDQTQRPVPGIVASPVGTFGSTSGATALGQCFEEKSWLGGRSVFATVRPKQNNKGGSDDESPLANSSRHLGSR
jgi:hypothetical protein